MGDRDRSAYARRARSVPCATWIALALAACGTNDAGGGGRSAGRPVDMHASHGTTGSVDNAKDPNMPGQTGSATGGGDAGAASGGAPSAPIGGADAGTFMPRNDLDPNVNFDWEETAPGSSDACQAGTYTGTFECEILYDPTMPDVGSGVIVTGPITLHFEKSANGEFLELADALLEGVGMDVFGFTADLSGKLDCATLELMSQAENGQYGLGLPIGIPLGDVQGTLEGQLDAQTHELSGTWSLSANAGTITCVGPWQGSYTP